VRYSGSPLPLSFSESKDKKEVRLLDVTADGIIDHSLPIPLHRRLTQIRTRHPDLEKDLKAFEPKTGELPTWVEVVVKDSTLEDDLAERVKQLSEGRDFEVLKIVRQRAVALKGLSAGESTDDEAIEELLDHPKQVFSHLLAQTEQLSAEESVALSTAFSTLVELDAQGETVESIEGGAA